MNSILHRRSPFFLGVFFLFAAIRAAIAEPVTVVESNNPGVYPWAFSSLPAPSATDYADSSQGNGVTIRIAAGAAENGSPPATILFDGEAQDNASQRQKSASFVWQGNQSPARYHVDLQEVKDLFSINTYCWHNGTRNVQNYTLYYSAAETAPDASAVATDGAALVANGWIQLSSVNFRPTGGTQSVASTRNTDLGPVVTARHLLFDLAKLSNAAYMGEFDITTTPPPFQLLTPRANSVTQRNDFNFAPVTVSGVYRDGAITSVEARMVPRAGFSGTATGWQVIDTTLDPDNQFAGELVAEGGWYDFEMRVMNGATEVATSSVPKVGVGEMFVTAGQSNSCNFGEVQVTPEDERVSAFNMYTGSWQFGTDPQPVGDGPKGSPWPDLGSFLAQQLDVPIGFLTVGKGSSSVISWLPGYDENHPLYEEDDVSLSDNDNYERLSQAVTQLENTSGFRCVLWHQGESDSGGARAPHYQTRLGQIIAQSRIDANRDFLWGVARVAGGGGGRNPDMVASQQALIDADPLVFEGADTDTLMLVSPTDPDQGRDENGEPYREANGTLVHFSRVGLRAHANLWLDRINAENIISMQPITITPPDLSLQSDTGISRADEITSDNTPEFFGFATVGKVVTLSSDVAGTIGTATADASTGEWRIISTTLADGVHQITASTDEGISTALPVTIDTVAPSVTLEQGPSQRDPAGDLPIVFDVAFSEEVVEFTAEDVGVSGTAAPGDVTIADGPILYTASVGSTAGNGEVTASIPAGVATDRAGNANSASTSQDNMVTYAEGVPVATIFEFNSPGTVDWIFQNLPSPSNSDYADISQGHGATVTRPMGAEDPNFPGGTAVLVDGERQQTSTDQQRSTSFQGLVQGPARLQMDLQSVEPIYEINTFSWHSTTRTDQRYTLYSSDAPTAPDATGLDQNALLAAGWEYLTVIDTNFPGQADRQVVVSSRNPFGSVLINARHLLWDLQQKSTVWGEFDVVTGPDSSPLDLTSTSDSGVSDTDNITNIATPTFEGVTLPGSQVALTSDIAGALGSTTADPQGAWSITSVALADGVHRVSSNVDAASLTITIDTTAPALAVNQAVGQSDPASSLPVRFDAVFDETVAGFESGDVSASGSAGPGSISVSGGPAAFVVRVNSIANDGDVTVTVPGAVATDIAGNANTPGAANDDTVSVAIATNPAYDAANAAVDDLGALSSPQMYDATGQVPINTVPAGSLQRIYFDALDYQGQPTKVFAWIGIPAGASAANPVPGIVLVHGGGGTAFRDWVQQWFDRGYAAISIGVEGQTDVNNPQGGWVKHQWPGPSRVGIYHDSDVEPFTDQWMYHAVADTVLANSLMRSLAQTDDSKVGIMGISWGGVITSTVMGIDNRFAFAIPMYGCGDLADARNVYGTSLTNNPTYREVLDPMVRLHRATMPSLWFSWNEDFHFPLDSQAACYHRSAGPHMMSAIPGLQHGHIFNSPEPFAFADSVVATGSPWLTQRSIELDNGIARVVFESTRPLDSAVLTYTTGNGHVGDLSWPEVPATLVQNLDGTYTASAALHANATAWYINVLSGEEYASSDYREINKLTLLPEGGLNAVHSLLKTVTPLETHIRFTGPTHADIVDVQFRNESHPGAFSAVSAVPFHLLDPPPALTVLQFQFDNSVANLGEGQTATATLTLLEEELDGSITLVELPVSITARTPSDVIYTTTSNWSSKTVLEIDDAIVRNNATVSLDEDGEANSITVNDGASPVNATLQIDQNLRLTVREFIQLGAGTGAGTVNQSLGVVSTNDLFVNASATGDLSQYNLTGGGLTVRNTLSVAANGEFNIDGGTLTGESNNFSSRGRLNLLSGVFNLNDPGATATSLIQMRNGTVFQISGGTFNQTGQFRIGQGSFAELRVIGDNATINMSHVNFPGISQGELNYVFGATGVSTIHSNGWLTLEGAKIKADGANYAGGPGTFILLDSGNLAVLADPANLTSSGFNLQGLEAAFVQDQDADVVQIVLTDHVADTVIYDVTSNWSSQEVFINDDVVINSDAVVTLDENAAGSTLTIGNQTGSTGELLVNTDFSIGITGTLILGANGGTGSLIQSGGDVSAASLAINAGGLFAVSGGNVTMGSGPVTVGADGPAEFRIIGDDATIQLNQLSQPNGSQGTFRFNLDAKGVCGIYSDVYMNLEGALIQIDGSAYTGDTQTIVLFDAPSLTAAPDNANITFAGFDDGVTVSVTVNSNRIELLIEVPDPLSVPDLTSASDTGTFDNDDITNDSTPTFEGTASPGASVLLRSNVAGPIGNVTANASTGEWSLTSETVLADGGHQITATAGSVTSDPLAITVDTIAPASGAPDMTAATDSGSSNVDNITNDSSPDFQGTSEADAVISFRDGGVEKVTFPVPGSGTWSISELALSEGNHSLTAVATDLAGNETASDALAIRIDTISPEPPARPDLTAESDSGDSDSDDLTNDDTPTVTTVAEAGSSIVLASDVEGGVGAGTGPSASITTTALRDGTHSLTATATDAAGNISGASQALVIIIDTVAPAAPSIPDLVSASDSGRSNTDNITNVINPTFTGTAAANTRVTLFRDVEPAGNDATGAWSISTSIPADGDFDFTAVASDVAGNDSLASDALTVTVDTAAPAAPTGLDLTDASDSGVSTSDDITKDNTPTITGDAESNSLVALLVDGTQQGSGQANSAFTITTAALADGNRAVTVTAEDIAGNISAASSALGVTIDTASPSVTLEKASGQEDPAPSGPVHFAVAANESLFGLTVDDFTVSGTAAGSPTLSGSNSAYTLSVNSSSDEGTVTAALSAGRATDAAGNDNTAATSSDDTVVLDSSTPENPTEITISGGNGSANGYLDDGDTDIYTFALGAAKQITIDTTGNLDTVGTLKNAADATINDPVADDDAGTDENFRTVQILNAGTYTVEVTAKTGSGDYGIHIIVNDLPILINEIDSLSAVGADGEREFIEIYDGGRGDTPLDGFVLVLFDGDDDASYLAIDLDGQSTDQNGFFVVGNPGIAEADLELPTPFLQDGQDAVALYEGNAGDFPENTAFTTTNLLDALVYLDDTRTDDGSLAGVLAAGQNPVAEAANGFAAGQSLQRIPDGAGGARVTVNVSAVAPTPGASNQLPAAPGAPDLTDASDTGTRNDDDITKEPLPAFSGLATPGTVVVLTSDLDGEIGTAFTQPDGTYTLVQTDAELSEGTHVITPATDADGSAGPTLTIEIDLTAPAAPSGLDLTDASDTGSSDADDITSDNTPTFTGDAETGSLVAILADGLEVGTGEASSPFSVTTSVIADGTVAITATASDIAGNVSAETAPLSVTIDTAGPTVTINQDGGQADPADTTPVLFAATFSESVSGFDIGDVVVSGSANPSDLSITGGPTSYTVTVGSVTGEGTITVDVPAGAVTDLAGNPSDASSSIDNTVVIDTHGDDPGNATALDASGGFAFSRGYLGTGDTDTFSFTVASTGTFRAQTTGNVDTVGKLRDNSGMVLNDPVADDDRGQGLNFLTEIQLSPGTYTVEVEAAPGESGDYEFLIEDVSQIPNTETFRPDALIGEKPEALRGNNVYGGDQKITLISRKARKVRAVMLAQNDGTSSDSLVIGGSRGDRDFDVRYFSAGANVTAQVVMNSFQTARLTPSQGQFVDILVKSDKERIRERRNGTVTYRKRKTTLEVRATSVSAAIADAVQIQVKTK